MTIGEFGSIGRQGLARRRRAKRSWRRILCWSTAAALAVAGLALLGYWLLTAPTFAIKRVESGSFRFTATEQVDAALTEFLGANIWSLSSGEIARRLGVLPWVRDVRVNRRLPDTIVVDFREWRPLFAVAPPAGAAAGNTGFVLLDDGRVVAFPAHLTMPGLPVLVGLELTVAAPGVWRLPPATTEAVLHAIHAIEDSGLEAAHPVDFLLAGPDGFTIVLQDGGSRLRIGNEDYVARIQRYLMVQDRVPTAIDVDLRFQDRISFPSRATATTTTGRAAGGERPVETTMTDMTTRSSHESR